MSVIRVLVSDPLAKEGLELLEKEEALKVDVKIGATPEELKSIIKRYDALIVRSETKVTKELLKHADNLKIIGRAGIGLDNIDLKEASKKGIIVMNSPMGNTVSTAEHTFSLLLSLSRNIPQADASLKNNKWERKKFMGVQVYGKTLGIIGLGRIGSEVAKRALSFSMKVLAYDPFLSQDKAKALGIEPCDLKTIFKESDYITVHTPLTEETKYIINGEAVSMMKNGVRVINCARGGIIDEAALLEGIKSGKVAGAALDVYETEPPLGSEIIKCDKIVTTPHLGASTEEAQANVALDVAKSVKDALLNKGIRNAVNMPCVDPEILKTMKPYLDLAEKIGLMQAQLIEGYIKSVKVTYVGEIVNQTLEPVTLSLIKGILSPILEEKINYVNALFIAKERGINVIERKSEAIEDFANLIAVTVETSKMTNVIMGTLFTKTEPRIVKVNNCYVEAVPKGHMLVIYNKDVPGIVGRIGTLLGNSRINIAGMTFGREKQGGKAITLINVDSEVSGAILKKIRDLKNINEVKYIKL